jgi:hypothetical protein
VIRISQGVCLKGHRYNNRSNSYLYINRRLNKGLANNNSYKLVKRS